MRYQRVVLKLSGQAISGDQDVGFSPAALDHIADQVLALHAQGTQVSVVIGGGNIFRGTLSDHWGIERAEAEMSFTDDLALDARSEDIALPLRRRIKAAFDEHGVEIPFSRHVVILQTPEGEAVRELPVRLITEA